MQDSDLTNQTTPDPEHVLHTDSVILPAPTAWPMVLALGLSLMITGMVTHWVISLLGLVLSLRAAVGWFFEVLPHEHHIAVAVQTEVITISSTRTARKQAPAGENHRKLLPIETFSITAGIRGGIVGGLAMIVPAGLFGLIGTTYGSGDGSTTFNIPDLRGRVTAFLDNMGGSAAGRIGTALSTDGGTINGQALGSAGGSSTHVQATGEMAQHNHSLSDPGHVHTVFASSG